MKNLDRYRYRVFKKPIMLYFSLGTDGLECNWKDFPKALKSDRSNVMQCTGLKDKEGRLIYEDDILIQVDPKADACGFPYQVRWDDSQAAFILDDGTKELLSDHNLSNYIVVGNIYSVGDDLLKTMGIKGGSDV